MDGPDSHPQWRRLSGSVGETSFDPPWVITGTHLIGNTNVRLPSDLQCGGPSSQLPNPLVVQQQLAGASSRRPLPLSYTRACRFASGKLRLPAGLTLTSRNQSHCELTATSRGLDERDLIRPCLCCPACEGLLQAIALGTAALRAPRQRRRTLTTRPSRVTTHASPTNRWSAAAAVSLNLETRDDPSTVNLERLARHNPDRIFVPLRPALHIA